jgi:hypothetical protein
VLEALVKSGQLPAKAAEELARGAN